MAWPRVIWLTVHSGHFGIGEAGLPMIWLTVHLGHYGIGEAGQAAQRPELRRQAQSVSERSGDTVLRRVS